MLYKEGNMTKVLFIYPDIREDAEEYTAAIAKKEYEGMYYTGIASISAVLKEHGHETKLFHITEPMISVYDQKVKKYMINKNGKFLYDELEEFNPDIVAFTSTTNQFEIVKSIVEYLHSYWKPNIVICGGVHAILAPEEVIAVEGIDAVCTGEGEYTLLEIADSKAWSHIDGIWYKGKTGTIYKNPMRKLIENLDELPFPDRDIFDYENTYGGKLGRIDMVVSRGCPYSCSYCCNHAIREQYKGCGKYFRMRSPENVVQECKELIKKFPKMTYFDFRDDSFTQDREWTLKFIELYKKEVNLPIVIISRADTIHDEELIQKLASIPCRMIRLGVESGNEDVLRTLHRVNITSEMIRDVAKLCARHGIKIYPFYMIGLPEETPSKFFDTIRLHGDLVMSGSVDINTYHLSVFYPFTKTKLYKYCEDKKLISERSMTNYFVDTTLDLPRFNREDIKFLRQNFVVLTKGYMLEKS